MTPDERQLLAGLFERIQSTASAPRDRDAEAFIADAVRAVPHAPYAMAQAVLVQEEALRAANQRVQQLEAQLRDAQAQAAAQPAPSFLGGLGKSLFGASSAPAASPAAPASPAWGRQAGAPQQPPAPSPWGGQPAPQPGPWGQAAGAAYAPASGGFLRNAMGAAAGIAGGVLLADSIRGLMGGHGSPFGMPFGVGGETVVNNFYGDDSREAAVHRQDALDDARQDADDDQRAADYAQDDRQDADDTWNTASKDSDSGGYSDDTTDV